MSNNNFIYLTIAVTFINSLATLSTSKKYFDIIKTRKHILLICLWLFNVLYIAFSIWWLIRYNNDINIASQKSENDRTSWEKTMLTVTNIAMPILNILGIALCFYIYNFNTNKYSVGDIIYLPNGRRAKVN
jgi:hypothetical protein